MTRTTVAACEPDLLDVRLGHELQLRLVEFHLLLSQLLALLLPSSLDGLDSLVLPGVEGGLRYHMGQRLYVKSSGDNTHVPLRQERVEVGVPHLNWALLE